MRLLAAALLWILAGIVPVSAGRSRRKLAYDRGDYSTARDIWLPLAKLGNARAQFSLGTLFANGKGVLKDEPEAVRLYRLAAGQGYDPAEDALARMYLAGRGVAKDDAEAAKWFRIAADHGNANSQAGLGFMYDSGRGVPQDDAEAVKWYRMAAEQGNPMRRPASASCTRRAKVCRRTMPKR